MLKSVRFLPLLLVSLLIMAVPSVQAAELPQFQLSTSQGLAGSQLKVFQEDACPTTEQNHSTYVFITFTDAKGVKTRQQSLVEKDGSWSFSPQLDISHKVVNRYDPSQTYEGAARGVGTIEAYCSVPSRPLEVAMQYQSQPFTVTGAIDFTLTPNNVAIEDTVQVRSAQPCPQSMSRIDVFVASGEISFHTQVVPNITGDWSVNVKIPKVVTDPMFGDRPFPVGKSVVSVFCEGEGAIQHYGDQVLEVKSKPIKYAALGDSYSSGLGTFKYYNTGNNCYRSELGYPPYVAKKLNLGEFTFAACSGAVTDDLFVANPGNANEPAQLSRLTADTEVVTLTIGGNDAGFEAILRECVNSPLSNGWGCSKSERLKKTIKKQFAGLSGGAATISGRPVHAIAEVLEQIQKHAPNARIYIGGYPRLFGEDRQFYKKIDKAPGGAACFVPIGASVSFKDALWLNAQSDALNSIVRQQAEAASKKGIRVTFVPPLFDGHGLCDRADAWLNGVVFGENEPLPPRPETFHPNMGGTTIGYGVIFEIMVKRG